MIAKARLHDREAGTELSSFSGAEQGRQLRLVQSLCDVSDQIGRVFDANRQANRGV
jgi:hypothetical protein